MISSFLTVGCHYVMIWQICALFVKTIQHTFLKIMIYRKFYIICYKIEHPNANHQNSSFKFQSPIPNPQSPIPDTCRATSFKWGWIAPWNFLPPAAPTIQQTITQKRFVFPNHNMVIRDRALFPIFRYEIQIVIPWKLTPSKTREKKMEFWAFFVILRISAST